MRLVTAATVVMLLCGTASSGQGLAPVEHPYGLDPFDPSDAELLRNYGSVLVAQTPLLELRQLDPFRPSDAALLRQLGGGLPLWGLWYPPGPTWAPLTPLPAGGAPIPSCCPVSITIQVPTALSAAAPAAAPSPGSSPVPRTAVLTALRPTSNDGVWIEFAGRRWTSGGSAASFDATAFVRIGEYKGFSVFRRIGGGNDVIYLPTREGVVAPYRLR